MKRLPGDVGFSVLIAMLYAPKSLLFLGAEKDLHDFFSIGLLGAVLHKPRKSFALFSSDLGVAVASP